MDIIQIIKEAIKCVQKDLIFTGITGIVQATQVKGVWQEFDSEFFDHEFVDQRFDGEDLYYGTIYLPLPNGEYLAMGFVS